jgi:hypothetical protein
LVLETVSVRIPNKNIGAFNSFSASDDLFDVPELPLRFLTDLNQLIGNYLVCYL